ncbi:MAG: hypothetical protein ACOYO1_11060 [Bacteroidales bacterium]
MSEIVEENNENENLSERLNYLERRIDQLESLLGIRKVTAEEYKALDYEKTADELKYKPTDEENESAMESKIGEFGLGWLGSIVFLFGIAFITQYIQSSGHVLFSTIFGYIAVGILFYVAFYIKNTIPGLSSKFNIISWILLFYITLRLHFFTNSPLFTEPYFPLFLLLLISGFQFYIANKNRSEFLSSIGIVLLLITANISKSTHFMLAIVSITVIFSVFILYKNNWWKQLISTLILSYSSFIIWYLIHISAENFIPKLATDQYSIAYLFICVSAFSMITLFKRRESISESIVFIIITLNGLFFTMILSMYMLSFFMNNYIGIFLSIFIICIVFSVFLKKYSEWKYTPAFYSLYGFVAISTAIYGFFGLPLAYLLLSIQSLLVVSMAIWFRSKIIVLMNFFLFIFLMIAYYSSSDSVHSINFSFALISIITARIINLQRNRLDIKTDQLRNIYLIIGFFGMLYALYKSVPMQYVTLSWSIAAVLYFILSILIHNIKYRWMAIFTMVAAAIYLFIVDLASVGIIYRIIAFMFLAIISISISVYYTKHKKKSISENNEIENL